MFTPSVPSYFFTLALLFATFHTGALGQDPERDPGTLFSSSLASFEKGDYREALQGFKALNKTQSGYATNAYYTGRCLVELNEDLDEAIELLYGASEKQVPADVIFYLGKAYHRDYNFREAQKYYTRFEIEGPRQEVKEHRVKQLINTCRSAMEITATYNQYEVMTVTFMDLSDSAESSQIRMKGGELQRKPDLYFSAGEDKRGLNSLMFMPVSPARGDYVFFSGESKNGKDGLQLFRVKKGTGRLWGDPEEIKVLNTEGDELLPYFDPIENDLYFASDGGRGIGGFDLFRSHFDMERDEWSEPINMGFPINSAMDEYLLLPGSDLGMMMFFSTRQGTDSTVTVYRVHLVEPKKMTNANDTRMLRDIANLGGVAGEILAELRAIPVQEVEHQDQAIPKAGPKITPVKIVVPAEKPADGRSEYQGILAEALMHQASSDSLKDLATAARIRVRESEDPNDRWVWQKQIIVWEKKAGDEEKIADELYARLDEDRTPSGPKTAVKVPEPVEGQAMLEGEPGTQPKVSVSQTSATHMNRFDILGESPYSEGNPVPLDVSLPEGVFYRIQLGAFGQAVEPGMFKGISPITAETIPERGLIKYYAGKFTRYEDASNALTSVRSNGYEDAFIVSWYNGNPISTEKAKQLE
ncbi:MAG: hypothetical protein V2B15_03740 [Bacteroidota bacterium]